MSSTFLSDNIILFEVILVTLQRLRDLREDNDLKQKDVAKVISVAQRTYSAYELGERMIPYPYIIELAKFYNTSTDYILGLTDVSEPYPKK